MAKQKIIDFDAYRAYFNDSALWDKIKNVAKALDAMPEFNGKIMFVSGGAVNQKSAKTQAAVPGGTIDHKLTEAEAEEQIINGFLQ